MTPETHTGIWHGYASGITGFFVWFAQPESWIMMLTIAALLPSVIINIPKALQAVKVMRKKK